ncbi:MAG: hypothetical protein ABJD97_13895 [Betaproteobacteria bacterium]
MKRRQALALPLTLVLPASALAQARIDGFKFGFLRQLGDRTDDFDTETRRLPLRLKGSGYRWGVHFVNPGAADIAWYEVIRRTAATGDAVVLRTPVKRSRERVIVDTFWFDETDRPGTHALDLFVDGTLRWTVSFEVVPA